MCKRTSQTVEFTPPPVSFILLPSMTVYLILGHYGHVFASGFVLILEVSQPISRSLNHFH